MTTYRTWAPALATFAISGALILAAAPARSSGINLAWNDCGTAGATIQSFACDTDQGAPFSLVASFVPPAGVGALIGVSGDLRISGPELPDWWKHGFEQCRGGTGLYPDVAFAPGACANPWPGSQTAEITYRPDALDPNTAFATVRISIPDGQTEALSAASEYHAFTLRVARTLSIGPDACAGCTDPVRLLLERIQLHLAPGAGEDPVIESALASSAAYWQAEVGTPPEITGITPDSGTPGTQVDIAGTNFTGTWSVRFGEAEASYTVASDQLIHATVPPLAQTGEIQVVTSFGSASSPGIFLVPPIVSDFLPRQSPAGSEVTIQGMNFADATAVEFNGVPASFTIESASAIRATVPNGSVEGPIRVTSPSGVGVSSQSFALGSPQGMLNLSWDECGLAGTDLKNFSCLTNFGPFDLIASFVPPPGIEEVVGMTATLRVTSDALPNWWGQSGTFCRGLCSTVDFSDDSGCTDLWALRGAQAFQNLELGYFGPGSARLTTWAYSTLGALDPATEYLAFRIVVASHPSRSSACDIQQGPMDFALDEIQLLQANSVVTPIHDVLNRNTAHWQGQSGPRPRVDAFSPAAGAPGTSVIGFRRPLHRGTLGALRRVRGVVQGGVRRAQISATVPPGARTGAIRVASPYGSDTSDESFIVAPRILSFTPRQALVGATVWIQGENLGDATQVTFHDGVSAAFQIISDSELRATVPAGAADGAIRVANPGGEGASKLSFVVGDDFVPGINLSWDDCGEAGATLYTFACDENSGAPFAMVASFLPPAGVAEFVGLSATLMIESESEILPSWWQHGLGYCRGTTRLSTAFDFRSGPYSCRDPFLGLGAGGYDYESHWDRPNLARLRIQCAVPYEMRGAVEPSDEYFAFKVHILRSKTTGDGACSGCDEPVSISLSEIQLFQPAFRGFDPIIATPHGASVISWQATKTTTPVLVSVVTTEATPDRVRLVWQTEDVDHATVQRREAEGPWRQVATLRPDGQRRMTYEDTSVTPGATYDYRLGVRVGFPVPGGEVYMGETRVTVPDVAAEPLALARVAWDGSAGALAVKLSLPRAGSASFELFDVNGRRLGVERLEGLEAGSHELSLRPGQALRPGVFFARLTQDREGVSRRFVVVQ